MTCVIDISGFSNQLLEKLKFKSKLTNFEVYINIYIYMVYVHGILIYWLTYFGGAYICVCIILVTCLIANAI